MALWEMSDKKGRTMSQTISKAPVVWTKDAWLDASTPRDVTKRHRGAELTQIDMAMDAWQNGYCMPSQKVAALFNICKMCHRWKDAKVKKTTPNSQWRRSIVQQLSDQAYARLQFETTPRAQPQDAAQTFRQKQIDSFEERKRVQRQWQFTGGKPLDVRTLQSGYARERETYLASGKTEAISGSQIHALLKNATTYGLAGKPPDFSKVTKEQFEQYVRTYGRDLIITHVKFFKKADRITKLVVVENGFLWDGPNHHFDTSGAVNSQYPYAIDEYGNLLSTFENDGLTKGNERFNHSTFNAGKDVICAGMLSVLGGRLVYIDTLSGHYAPTKENLCNALTILRRSCRIDLRAVTCAAIELNRKYKSGRAISTYAAAGLEETRNNTKPTTTDEWKG